MDIFIPRCLTTITEPEQGHAGGGELSTNCPPTILNVVRTLKAFPVQLQAKADKESGLKGDKTEG
jgi:hypothetical protein